jgi:hypothetical protein
VGASRLHIRVLGEGLRLNRLGLSVLRVWIAPTAKAETHADSCFIAAGPYKQSSGPVWPWELLDYTFAFWARD